MILSIKRNPQLILKNRTDYKELSYNRLYSFNQQDDYYEETYEGIPLYESLFLTPFSGDTFNFNISGSTLLGGFYQGIHTIEEADYNVLPQRYKEGITLIFELRREDIINETDLFTLNEYNPNNKGFFFYYGARSTDPDCGRENDEYDESFEEVNYLERNNINPFLFYTRKNICENQEEIIYYEHSGCEEDVVNNAFGIRLTDEGRINIRYITNSGSCVDESYISEMTVIDEYSDIIVVDNEWHQYALRFNYRYPCDEVMTLEIFVDTKLKYKTKVPHLFSYKVKNAPPEISHNISIGGGTIGNLLNTTPIISKDNVCEYQLCIEKNAYINAITINEEIIVNDNLSIVDFLTSLFGENFEYSTISHGRCVFYKVKIITDEELSIIAVNNDFYNFTKVSCSEYDSPIASNIIGENFAGTFEGEICDVYIYDKKLPVQFINDLYEQFVIEKNIIKPTCC